ncbi:MAG: hypothetical protein IPP81_19040 [Chitinophagaceae bacterium]|nr:hypothetical protein [Chitinophagaceae bacterium]
MTLQQSSAVHIQALVSADGILPGFVGQLRLLVINLASAPSGQLVNSPTTKATARWWQQTPLCYYFVKRELLKEIIKETLHYLI